MLIRHLLTQTGQRVLVSLMKFGPILLILTLSSCSVFDTNPSMRPALKWFKGSHKEKGLIGPALDDFVPVSSKRFDIYACLGQDDFKVLMEYVIKIENDYGQ